MKERGASAKRILFVSSASTLYGGERSLLEIVKVMSPVWRPWFVVPAKGPYSAALDDAKFPYDVIPPHAGRRQILTVLRLAWIIRRRRVSLIHANLQFAVPLVARASKLSGVPFLAHFRNMILEPFDEQTKRPFRAAAGSICISQAVKSAACEAGVFSSQQHDRIWIIPDARNLSKYAHGKRAAIRAELRISDDTPLIGMIARIERMKGQHILLEAAALITDQMPTARFLLVGDAAVWDPDYLAMLKRRCEDPRLKHRVTFLGYRTDVPDILAALDCFVHPSSRGAFVSVLIEAMAAGIPLVVSDVDGIPECVGREGTAELIGNLEPMVWANAIMQIIRGPIRRASMSRACRERAKRYDVTRLARETEAVFAHCLT